MSASNESVCIFENSDTKNNYFLFFFFEIEFVFDINKLTPNYTD